MVTTSDQKVPSINQEDTKLCLKMLRIILPRIFMSLDFYSFLIQYSYKINSKRDQIWSRNTPG